MKASGGKNMNEKFAENLVRLRKEKGLTQAEVAEKLNVSAQAVSKWENGDSLPDVSLLSSIADLYGTSIDELFGKGCRKPVACNLRQRYMGDHYHVRFFHAAGKRYQLGSFQLVPRFV